MDEYYTLYIYIYIYIDIVCIGRCIVVSVGYILAFFHVWYLYVYKYSLTIQFELHNIAIYKYSIHPYSIYLNANILTTINKQFTTLCYNCW